MKNSFAIALVISCSLAGSLLWAANIPENPSRWINLLKKGSALEKQVALERLWILEDPRKRQDDKVFDPIIAALSDKNASVRQAAAVLLRRIGEDTHGCCRETRIIPALAEALRDKDAAVRMEAAKALAYYPDQRSADALVQGVEDPDIWVRLYAVHSLGSLGARGERRINVPRPTPAVTAVGEHGGMIDISWGYKLIAATTERVVTRKGKKVHIIDHLENPKHPNYDGVVFAQYEPFPKSAAFGADRVVGECADVLKDDSRPELRYLQQECTITLGKIRTQDEEAIGLMVRKAQDPYLRKYAYKALGRIRTLEAESVLTKGITDTDPRVRRQALDALLRLPIDWKARRNAAAIARYGGLLTSPLEEVRILAVAALSSMGGEQPLRYVQTALYDKSDAVVLKALQSLSDLYDEDVLIALVDLFGHNSSDVRDLAVRQFNRITAMLVNQNAYSLQASGRKYVAMAKIGQSTYKRVDPRHIYNAHIPEKILSGPYREYRRFVNARVVSRLTACLAGGNATARRLAVKIISLYEDERIEKGLINLLHDESDAVVVAAVDALASQGTSRSVSPLLAVLESVSPGLKAQIIRTLGAIGDRRAAGAVKGLLSDKEPVVRAAALECLLQLSDTTASGTAVSILNTSQDRRQLSSAIHVVKKTRDKSAVVPLVRLLDTRIDTSLPVEAAEALAEIGDMRAVEPLVSALGAWLDKSGPGSRDTRLPIAVCGALGKIGSVDAVPVLLRALRSGDSVLQPTILKALGQLNDKRAVPAIIEMTRAGTFSESVRALGDIGDPSALDFLEMHLFVAKKKWTGSYPIITAIGKIHDERSVEILLKYLYSDKMSRGDDRIVVSALEKKAKSRSVILQIISYAGKVEPDYLLNLDILRCVLPQDSEKRRKILDSALENENSQVRLGAVYLYHELRDPGAIRPLKRLLDDRDQRVRENARETVRWIESRIGSDGNHKR